MKNPSPPASPLRESLARFLEAGAALTRTIIAEVSQPPAHSASMDPSAPPWAAPEHPGARRQETAAEPPPEPRTLKVFCDGTYTVIAYDTQDVMRVIEESGMGEPDAESEKFFLTVPMDELITAKWNTATGTIAAFDDEGPSIGPCPMTAAHWIETQGRCFLLTTAG
jgi:hypothetical protein